MYVKALKAVVGLVLIFTARSGWGLLPSTQGYLEAARARNLWREQKWLRLGHYRKGLFSHHSPFVGPFFISAHGASDPAAELERTLVAFLEPTAADLERYKMAPHCYFGARWRWLQKELNLPTLGPCTARVAWKKQLNARALSLIFAASDLGTATSSFGHTFLKLSNPDNLGRKELIDYGINYAADADKNEGVLYAVKGLFGFYRGHYSLLPYHQKIREYTNLEGRDIWEYPMSLSPDEVAELIDHLLELENSGAPYFFLSNNCSFEILKALEVVRPDLHVSEKLPWFVIPLDTLKALARDSTLVQPGKYRQSLKSDYVESYRQLNFLQRKALGAAVEKLTVPSDYELNAEQRSQVFETAMKFYALRAFQRDEDLDDAKYRLSVQRAHLGVFPAVGVEPPRSPDQSHDSSALSTGLGEDELGHYQSLKFRSAFHELEQNDNGAVKFSHSEILAFEARHFTEQSRWSLARATLIHLVNTSPVTTLDRALSWKARFELVDAWRSEAEAGMGYSFDAPLRLRLRAVTLLTAQYEQSHPRAGPNLILITRVADRVGASVDTGLYYNKSLNKPETQLKAKLDYQLKNNWDLQLELQSPKDHQIKIMYNFLL